MTTDNLFCIKNKVVFLTGTASGIGQQFAIELANRGAHVIGTYHQTDISETILKAGKNFTPYQIDLENILEADIHNIWLFSLERFKCLPNILINCAGINLRSWIEDYSIDDWNKTLEINLTSPFKLCQSFAKNHLEYCSSAKIINISSLTAFQTGKRCTGYTVSKHGINGLTKILANELGKYNITANCIAPGYIYTDMTSEFLSNPIYSQSYLDRIALGRWGTTNDLIGALIYLCSNASNYITGTTIFVDGGYINS